LSLTTEVAIPPWVRYGFMVKGSCPMTSVILSWAETTSLPAGVTVGWVMGVGVGGASVTAPAAGDVAAGEVAGVWVAGAAPPHAAAIS
jgi:hypothetical protein